MIAGKTVRPITWLVGGLVGCLVVLAAVSFWFRFNPVAWAAQQIGVAPVHFDSDFETGQIQCRICTVDGWSIRNNSNRPDALAVVGVDSGAPVRSGEYAVRITADYSDDWDPNPKVELSAFWQPFFEERIEYWVGWSIYLPDDGGYEFDSSYQEVMLQVHATNDDCDAGGMGPTHSLRPLDGRWRWDVRWSAARCMGSEPDGQEIIDIGPQQLGRWTDFVARFVFSHGNEGITQVWRDGELVVDRVGAPNHYNDEHGPYLKLGFYKAGWLNNETDVDRRVFFYDAVTVFEGEDGYSIVDPSEAQR